MSSRYRALGVGCRVTVLVALLAAILALALPAVAFDQGGREDFHGKINPTPEQREKLQAYRTEHREKVSQLKDSIRAAHRDLFTELREYKLDQSKVNTTVERISTLQRQLLLARLDNQLALRRILTRDQFDKLGSAVRGIGTGHERHAGPHEGMGLLADKIQNLGLSSSQQERIKRLFQESASANKTLVSQLRDSSKDLHELYLNFDLDQKQAKSLIGKIADARLKLLKSTIARQQELRKILTEQQFEELAKAMQPPDNGRMRHGDGKDE